MRCPSVRSDRRKSHCARYPQQTSTSAHARSVNQGQAGRRARSRARSAVQSRFPPGAGPVTDRRRGPSHPGTLGGNRRASDRERERCSWYVTALPPASSPFGVCLFPPDVSLSSVGKSEDTNPPFPLPPHPAHFPSRVRTCGPSSGLPGLRWWWWWW